MRALLAACSTFFGLSRRSAASDSSLMSSLACACAVMLLVAVRERGRPVDGISITSGVCNT